MNGVGRRGGSESFCEAVRAAGREPPDVVQPDMLYRIPGAGKRSGNRAGWCKLFSNGMCSVFGDWSTEMQESWLARRRPAMDYAGRTEFRRRVAEARRDHDRLRQAEKQAGAESAQHMFTESAAANPAHLYQRRRGVLALGINQHHEGLLGPVRSLACSLQFTNATP